MQMLIKYALVSFALIYFTACKHQQSITKKTKEVHSDKHSNQKESISSSLKKKYADKLGVSESAITNQKLYQFINDWYSVPYKYAGKDKSGIDCSGLASTLYDQVYHKKISPSTKIVITEVKKISEDDLQEGDLVFFNTDSKGPSHVGVYLQHYKFVHASTKKGVMISDLNEPYFKKCYLSAGRVK